ncbi:MAG: hypothetical protein AAGA48_35255 [Myxococcota bacterium]
MISLISGKRSLREIRTAASKACASLIIGLLVACGLTPADVVEPVMNPFLNIDRSDQAPFEGTVTALRPAGGYVYVAVDETWVVGFDKALALGDSVIVKPFGRSRDFTSKRTGDHYDELVFGIVSKATP